VLSLRGKGGGGIEREQKVIVGATNTLGPEKVLQALTPYQLQAKFLPLKTLHKTSKKSKISKITRIVSQFKK
jgi:hypothetical protein